MKKWSWLLALGLLLSVLLAACGGDNDNTSSNEGNDGSNNSKNNTEETANNEGEDEGSDGKQVLNLTNGDKIPEMDPNKTTDEFGIQFAGETMEGLYRLKDGEAVEGIAKDHEKSEDGTEWTFHLREDAKWENGDPVTAHDFVYSWRRAVDPETGSEYGPFMMGDVLKNATAVNEGEADLEELGVEAVDDYTLKATLQHPVPYFESLMTFPTYFPLNKEFVEEKGDKFATTSDALLSNGPYKLEDWESTSDSWKLVKNEDYWDADEVSIDEINYDVVDDPQVAVDLYEKGEVDRAGLSSDLVDQYRSDDAFETELQASLFYLKLNQEANDALANKNIRKAIARSFNKQAMADEILNNGSKPSTGFVPADFVKTPSGEPYHEATGDLVEFDKEKAQELWQKGLDEIGQDSVELELLAGDSATAKEMNEYLANQMSTNLDGLDVTLKQVPFKQRLDLDTNMEYEMQFTGWGPDFLDPYTMLTLWETDGENNKTGFSNEKYDKLMEQTKEDEYALNPEKRYENFMEAGEILAEEAPIAPIYQKGVAKLVRPKVKGVISNDFGPSYEYKWAEIDSGE